MLNLLKKAENDIQDFNNVEELVSPRSRAFRLVTGGILLANSLRNKDQANFMCNVSKIVGGAFILYGLTGWDPLKLNRKTVKVPH